jgi:hypothetical protein
MLRPYRPAGVGEALGVGVAIGVGVSLGVGVSVGVGVAMSAGDLVGLGEGLGVMSDGVKVEGDDVGDGLAVGLCWTVAGNQPRAPK